MFMAPLALEIWEKAEAAHNPSNIETSTSPTAVFADDFIYTGPYQGEMFCEGANMQRPRFHP